MVKPIVVASSDKAYGDQAVLALHRRHAAAGPPSVRRQQVLRRPDRPILRRTRFGLPVAITRCGNFYGGGDLNWNRIVPGTIRSVLRGERPVIRSDGQYVRDYFYVEDGAAAYMLLAERLTAGPEVARQAFNFSNELQITVLELVNDDPREDGFDVWSRTFTIEALQRDPPPVPERRARAHGLEVDAAVHAGRRSGEDHRLVPGVRSKQ